MTFMPVPGLASTKDRYVPSGVQELGRCSNSVVVRRSGFALPSPAAHHVSKEAVFDQENATRFPSAVQSGAEDCPSDVTLIAVFRWIS
jgi:hypothetical protein